MSWLGGLKAPTRECVGYKARQHLDPSVVLANCGGEALSSVFQDQVHILGPQCKRYKGVPLPQKCSIRKPGIGRDLSPKPAASMGRRWMCSSLFQPNGAGAEEAQRCGPVCPITKFVH